MATSPTPVLQMRDAARTRDIILRAAQTLFAQNGYTTSGVREVAFEAGVNSALVRRYFGSKEGLLRAAVQDVLEIGPLIGGSRAEFGRRAVAVLLHGGGIPSPFAMMLLATADPAARILCRDLLQERIIVPLAEWLGPPRGLDRAVRLNLLWMGFMTTRHILPLQPLLDDPAPTREWLEDMTQAIADEAAAPGRPSEGCP